MWITPFELYGVDYQAGDALHPALRADESMMRNFWMSRLIDFVGADGLLSYSPGFLLTYSDEVKAQLAERDGVTVPADGGGEVAGGTTDFSGGGETDGGDPPADEDGPVDPPADEDGPVDPPAPPKRRRRAKAAS